MRKRPVGLDGSLAFPRKTLTSSSIFALPFLFLLGPVTPSADEMDWSEMSSVLLHVADKIDPI